MVGTQTTHHGPVAELVAVGECKPVHKMSSLCKTGNEGLPVSSPVTLPASCADMLADVTVTK